MEIASKLYPLHKLWLLKPNLLQSLDWLQNPPSLTFEIDQSSDDVKIDFVLPSLHCLVYIKACAFLELKRWQIAMILWIIHWNSNLPSLKLLEMNFVRACLIRIRGWFSLIIISGRIWVLVRYLVYNKIHHTQEKGFDLGMKIYWELSCLILLLRDNRSIFFFLFPRHLSSNLPKFLPLQVFLYQKIILNLFITTFYR